MINCLDVQFSFDKNIILKSCNFEWNKGELNLLLGRNGVGKSTFLRLMADLLRPQQGVIRWNEKEVPDYNELIALIESPQIPLMMKANEFLKEHLSFYKNADLNSIEPMLKEWGVPTDKKMGKLSQGNLQKIQVLRCLLSGSPFIILDEPTAHLDPFQVQFFWTKIRDFQTKGISFLISSHHLSEMFVPDSQVYLLHEAKLDKVKPDKPWRWRLLFKNVEKGHYCDEEFFNGTMEECNQFVKESIDSGRQLLQMVAADWDIPEKETTSEFIEDELL